MLPPIVSPLKTSKVPDTQQGKMTVEPPIPSKALAGLAGQNHFRVRTRIPENQLDINWIQRYPLSNLR
jgi:hypothetical protein